jgi:ABC-type uncharacterized transport system ATPase subunit
MARGARLWPPRKSRPRAPDVEASPAPLSEPPAPDKSPAEGVEAPALELRGIWKSFGAVIACQSAGLTLRAGEIRALLGENGAGKSTLMNVASGLYQPDAGEILVRGRTLHFRSPSDAIAAGLGMAHQHFMLPATLTALENLILGAEPARRLWGFGPARIDWKAARASFEKLCGDFGFDLLPDRLAGDLTVGERQRLEILKTLYRGAQVLLLDEPTAVLTPQEADRLFELLRRLASDKGVAILLTSHKLEEVLAVGDRYTVMRDGAVAGEGDVAGVSKGELVRLMVGREVDLDARPERPPLPEEAPVRLCLESVSTRRGFGRALENVSLEVKSGEILGIAGVDGNGQSALEAVIAGWTRPASGIIELEAERVERCTPLERLIRGLSIIPGDRHERAAALDFSLHENLLLGYTARRLSRWRGGPRGQSARLHVRDLIVRFGIQPPNPWLPMRSFSGGNQQKAIAARAIDAEAPVLLAVNPTRGVDVGAIENIHARIRQRRDAGSAILLISTELSELLALADRIQVLHRGKLSGSVPGDQADPLELGRLMMCGEAESGEE